MKYPTVKFVFDRKHVASLEKKGLVQIEVYFEGKRTWISTGVKLYANQWDDRKKVVRSADSINLNTRLDTQMGRISDYITERVRNGQPFNIDALKDTLRDDGGGASFVDFAKKRIKERKNVKASTNKQYVRILKVLEEYGKFHTMEDMTRQNIMVFDNYLHDLGLNPKTVYSYHTKLSLLINEAVRFGYIASNPYRELKLHKVKSKPRDYLTGEELAAFQALDIEAVMAGAWKSRIEHLKHVKDLFLFQCYTGLSVSDMNTLDYVNGMIVKDGKYMIADRRLKTDEDYKIVLLPPAVEILEKYGFKLPRVCLSSYNDNLKFMAKLLGINKNVSSHTGRHSFAVYALNHGVPIEVLSKMMGHTNIRTTQIYAKVLESAVEKGFELLARSFNAD